MDLGHRQRPLLHAAGHPLRDLLLEPQQLLPRRPVAIRSDRTHRLGHHPDQGVVNSADIVVTAQPIRLSGFYVAAHRLAVQAAMRGDRAVARRR
jgi:hypothetical protein